MDNITIIIRPVFEDDTHGKEFLAEVHPHFRHMDATQAAAKWLTSNPDVEVKRLEWREEGKRLYHRI